MRCLPTHFNITFFGLLTENYDAHNQLKLNFFSRKIFYKVGRMLLWFIVSSEISINWRKNSDESSLIYADMNMCLCSTRRYLDRWEGDGGEGGLCLKQDLKIFLCICEMKPLKKKDKMGNDRQFFFCFLIGWLEIVLK